MVGRETTRDSEENYVWFGEKLHVNGRETKCDPEHNHT